MMNDLTLKLFNFVAGGEEGRTIGWSSADPSRRRHSGPLINAGGFSKQKSPVVNDSTAAKDSMVCILLLKARFERVSVPMHVLPWYGFSY